MRYEVPQFIEVEDKIFGPLSFRQFAYVAGAVGFCVIIYRLAGLFLAILLGIPFLLVGVSLAFYKVNNRPFSYMLLAGLSYLFNRKLYLWMHRTESKEHATKRALESEKIVKPYVPKVSENKLKDLAWSLDIKDIQAVQITLDEIMRMLNKLIAALKTNN